MENIASTVHSRSSTQNEDWQGQLIYNIPAAIYVCDAEGYIKEYNQAAVDLWGREPEIGVDRWSGSSRIYRLDGSLLPVEEYPMAISLKEQKPIYDQEIIVERPDGSRKFVETNPRPLFDSSGNMTGALNMLVDITDRKLNEERAARLAAIVEFSDDAIIGKTLQGIVTSWNRAAERIFGYTAAETVGESVTKLMPEDRLGEEPKILERLKRGERVDHFETKRMTKDGRLLDVSLTISPIKDKAGNIIGASKIARDITPMKTAQSLIHESVERLKMAVSSTGLGTWEYSPVSGELHWSEECRMIYDIPLDVPVTYDLFSSLVYPDDAELAQSAIWAAMNPAGSGDYDVQFRISRYSNGAVRWIRSQGKVYFNDEKQAEKFIGTVLDITEEKSSREELERTVEERTKELKNANANLAKSNKELEQFAYVASHDLQEPLRKIQTFAEMLRLKGEGALNDDLNLYLEKIALASQKMSRLIKDLLEYARISPSELVFTTTDLNETLRSAIDDLDLQITQKGARITADDLPVIEALPSQMRQLFYNLINNSLKFTPEARKTSIEIHSRELDKRDIKELGLSASVPYYELTVSDNGIGFNNEYAERIFTIFQRLNSLESFPGTGIGLALCKRVVDNHNGIISASGVEDTGAVFTIILPGRQKRAV